MIEFMKVKEDLMFIYQNTRLSGEISKRGNKLAFKPHKIKYLTQKDLRQIADKLEELNNVSS